MNNIKITAIHDAEEDIEQEKLSSIDDGRANLCNHFGNQYVSFSETGNFYLKINIYKLGHIPKGHSPHDIDTCSTMFIAVLYIKARNWKLTRWPSNKEWIKKL